MVDKVRARRQVRWASLALLAIPLVLGVIAIFFADGWPIPRYVFIVPLIGSLLATIGFYFGYMWRISNWK